MNKANEVRIYRPYLCYDKHVAPLGFVEAVIPSLEFDNIKKFEPHACAAPDCKQMTTRRHYCSDDCKADYHEAKRKKKEEEKKAAEERKPKRYCAIPGCRTILTKRRKKFCSIECNRIAQREKDQDLSEENRKNKLKQKRRKQ